MSYMHPIMEDNMAIQARMYVSKILERGFPGRDGTPGTQTQEDVELEVVYSEDRESPNFSFSEATPQGGMQLTITNPKAWGFFEPGATYNIEIRKHVPTRSQKKDDAA